MISQQPVYPQGTIVQHNEDGTWRVNIDGQGTVDLPETDGVGGATILELAKVTSGDRVYIGNDGFGRYMTVDEKNHKKVNKNGNIVSKFTIFIEISYKIYVFLLPKITILILN